MKRGIFFSTDAMVALSIILFVIILAYPLVKKDTFGTEIHYDVLDTLSTLKTAEVDNAYIQSLIATGQINATNKTLVEDIGELYITNPQLAQDVAESVLDSITTNENIGIWYDTTRIASKNETPFEGAREVRTTRQLLSGIKAGENITGVAARALLKTTAQTTYTYFGGYVGEGNLTFIVQYNGTIVAAEMEITVNKDFDLYLNNQYVNHYAASPSETTPSRPVLP